MSSTPVQTSSKGMAAQDLKSTYGKAITFHGAVEGMEGPVDRLVAEVRERIECSPPEAVSCLRRVITWLTCRRRTSLPCLARHVNTGTLRPDEPDTI